MMSNLQTDASPPFLADRVVPLNFDEVVYDNELPKTYVESSPGNNLSETLIPVIDVSDPGAGHLMCNACEKWGVFQLTGHELSVSILNEVEAETRRLFGMPMERKMQAVMNPGDFNGYGLPKMSKFYPDQIWSEGFTIRGSPAVHVARLWPNKSQCKRFCNVMKEYQRKLDILSKKIITLMITSLGLKNDDVEWLSAIDKNPQALPSTALRLNSYPICPNPSKSIGMAPHTDTSIITLLYQGNVGGLQIQMDDGEWVNVKPVEGALIVNLGDLMEIFTNGKLKSVMHRVMVNGSRHRISVGYFFGPARDVEVAPAEKLVEERKCAMYPGVTWDEYMQLKHTHGQKALQMIKKT